VREHTADFNENGRVYELSDATPAEAPRAGWRCAARFRVRSLWHETCLVRHSKQEDLMPKPWTDKEDRQYEHIKDSVKARGESLRKAKEIAARTVNKQRRKQGSATQHAALTLHLLG
jgi:hypothetical protein